MLNAKALSDLLSDNSDERLCKCWWLMTPNGTLLAHTQPVDVRSLRRKVAMAALSWQEHQNPGSSEANGELRPGAATQQSLSTLIIESEASNVLIHRIRPELLLALEGGVPPRKRNFEVRITAEGSGGEPLHDSAHANAALGTSVSSRAESSMSTASSAGSVLGLHRRKLDAMAAAIASDFEQTGFTMPDESVNKYF